MRSNVRRLALVLVAAVSVGCDSSATSPDSHGAPPPGAPSASAPTTAGAEVGDEPTPGTLIDREVVDGSDLYVALTTDQMVSPPADGTASYGEATLTFDGDTVSIVVAVELPEGDREIGAGIYVGDPGIDGAPRHDLGAIAPGSAEGQAIWTAEIVLPDLAEAWRGEGLGRFYVEVVTERGPTGLVRGQLDHTQP